MCKLLQQAWWALHHLTTSPHLPPTTPNTGPRRTPVPVSPSTAEASLSHTCVDQLTLPTINRIFPPAAPLQKANPFSKQSRHSTPPAVRSIPELPWLGRQCRPRQPPWFSRPWYLGPDEIRGIHASTPEDLRDLQQMTYLFHIQLSP